MFDGLGFLKRKCPPYTCLYIHVNTQKKYGKMHTELSSRSTSWIWGNEESFSFSLIHSTMMKIIGSGVRLGSNANSTPSHMCHQASYLTSICLILSFVNKDQIVLPQCQDKDWYNMHNALKGDWHLASIN